MKNILLYILVFSSSFIFAQSDLEDDDRDLSQFNSSKTFVDIQPEKNIEFFRLKCENPVYASYSEGLDTFKNILKTSILDEVVNGKYSVNGKFSFVFEIDRNGMMQNLKVTPVVTNSHLLFNDFDTAFRTSNIRWNPAKCNGESITSKLRLKVNFLTITTDL